MIPVAELLPGYRSSDTEEEPEIDFWSVDDHGGTPGDEAQMNWQPDDTELTLEERTETGQDDPAVAEARREVFETYHHQIRPPRQRRDQRTRVQRNASTYASWEVQAPDLLHAYLGWRYGSQEDAGQVVGRDGVEAVQPSYFEVTAIDIKRESLFS